MPTKKTIKSKQATGLKAHAKRHFHRYFAGFAVATLVLSFSLFGTTQLGESDAASKDKIAGIVNVKAYTAKCTISYAPFPGAAFNKHAEEYQKCSKAKVSKVDLFVSTSQDRVNDPYIPKGYCNGKLITAKPVNFKKVRKIKCTDGMYKFELAGSTPIMWHSKKISSKGMDAYRADFPINDFWWADLSERSDKKPIVYTMYLGSSSKK
jgi:hypothetical protein